MEGPEIPGPKVWLDLNRKAEQKVLTFIANNNVRFVLICVVFNNIFKGAVKLLKDLLGSLQSPARQALSSHSICSKGKILVNLTFCFYLVSLQTPNAGGRRARRSAISPREPGAHKPVSVKNGKKSRFADYFIMFNINESLL